MLAIAWLVAQLGGSDAAPAELLAGRPAKPAPDRGPVVCVCFDIGMRTIINAINDRALTSVDAVGAALRAGTNYGSCRPAIARMIEDQMADAPSPTRPLRAKQG